MADDTQKPENDTAKPEGTKKTKKPDTGRSRKPRYTGTPEQLRQRAKKWLEAANEIEETASKRLRKAQSRVHHEVMGAAWAARKTGKVEEFLTKLGAALAVPDETAARLALLSQFMEPTHKRYYQDFGLLPKDPRPTRPKNDGCAEPEPAPAPVG
jgi:hypothetical protein